MAGIEDVLERLVTDAAFRAALARDPGAALLEYDLTREDIELLAGQLDVGDDEERTVEQRTSKSAMLGLLGLLADLPGGESEASAAGALKTIASAQTDYNDTGPVLPGDIADTGDTGDATSAIELEPARVTSYSFHGSGDDAPPPTTDADPDAPVIVGQVPNPTAEHEVAHVVQQDGGAAPTGELVQEVDPGQETYTKSGGKVEYSWKVEEGVMSEEDLALSYEELGSLPEEQQQGLRVPGSDLTEPTDAEVEEDLPMMPNPEELSQKVAPAGVVGADEVAGDAGVGPTPRGGEGMTTTTGQAEVPDVDDEPGGLPGVDDDPGALPSVDDQLVGDLPSVDDAAAPPRGAQGAEELADDVFEIGDA